MTLSIFFPWQLRSRGNSEHGRRWGARPLPKEEGKRAGRELPVACSGDVGLGHVSTFWGEN
jgi:hypothetical protein